jgi:hypothetical protein
MLTNASASTRSAPMRLIDRHLALRRAATREDRYLLTTRLTYNDCAQRLRQRRRWRWPLGRRREQRLAGRVESDRFSVRLTGSRRSCEPRARGTFIQAAPGTQIELVIGLGAWQRIQNAIGWIVFAIILCSIAIDMAVYAAVTLGRGADALSLLPGLSLSGLFGLFWLGLLLMFDQLLRRSAWRRACKRRQRLLDTLLEACDATIVDGR